MNPRRIETEKPDRSAASPGRHSIYVNRHTGHRNENPQISQIEAVAGIPLLLFPSINLRDLRIFSPLRR
jgi:hypothetical protein